MGFGSNIVRAFNRFGAKAKSDLTGFGNKVVKGFNQGVDFVEKKALPAVEKYAGKGAKLLSKGADYAKYVPLIGDELAIAGKLGSVGLSAVSKGAGVVRGAIGTGRQLVEAVKRGDGAGAMAAGKMIRQQVSPLTQGKMLKR